MNGDRVRTFDVRSGADLGRAVAEARSAKGLTQKEVGTLVGLDARYLSKIESGRTVSLLEHQLRILRRLGARIIVELPGSTDGS